MAKKKKASLGCLFWVALILLVLVVFFFNRERIQTVIEDTGFKDYIFQQEPRKPEVKRIVPEKEEPKPAPRQPDTTEQPAEPTEPRDAPEEDDAEQDVEITIDTLEEEPVPSPDATEEPLIDKRMRKSALYFVEVNDAGVIELKRIIRPVYYTNSPLTETLKALLEGLTAEELNQGLINLIPQETQLRSVWVENGTAFIDFTEAIRFNQFGPEGLHAELQQIVYTATEFQTVESVQILINGDKIDYLASEGIFVGKPLTRKDFAGSSG
ncbi:MAG: GerMN domain-containing protein [Spirochaetia bacterium]